MNTVRLANPSFKFTVGASGPGASIRSSATRMFADQTGGKSVGGYSGWGGLGSRLLPPTEIRTSICFPWQGSQDLAGRFCKLIGSPRKRLLERVE